LDENYGLLQVIPGYLKAEQIEPILTYLGTDVHKTTKWEDFTKTFKGQVVPE
jgi:thioredoxin-related protein